jgi:hypothetical protein
MEDGMKLFRRITLAICVIALPLAAVLNAMSTHEMSMHDVWSEHPISNWWSCSAMIEKSYTTENRFVEVNIYSPSDEWIAHAANTYESGSIVHASTGFAPNGTTGTFRCVATFTEDSETDELTEYIVVS